MITNTAPLNPFKSASIEFFSALRANDMDRAIDALDLNGLAVTPGTDNTRTKFLSIRSKSDDQRYTELILEGLQARGVGMKYLNERRDSQARIFLTIYLDRTGITGAVVGYGCTAPIGIRTQSPSPR
jgi:hypothetical protein